MQRKTINIIQKLARKIKHLEKPIHILAVCSGGRGVAKEVVKFLRKNKIDTEYYEVWTNIICGKSVIWKTDFNKNDYNGTIVIIDDVIWQGRQIRPIKKMLKKMNPKKKFYVAALLDCNKKADFSIYN